MHFLLYLVTVQVQWKFSNMYGWSYQPNVGKGKQPDPTTISGYYSPYPLDGEKLRSSTYKWGRNMSKYHNIKYTQRASELGFTSELGKIEKVDTISWGDGHLKASSYYWKYKINMDENIEICKVSDWSSWGECTKPCGGGVQYATRFPLHDGYNEYDCGSLSKSQTCNSNPCPTSSVAFFKSIDYKNKKFKGWDEVDVPNICKNVEKKFRSFG